MLAALSYAHDAVVASLCFSSDLEDERMKQLGIGLIGAGMVANLHAEAVARCAGARLDERRGLWNRTPQRAEEKARAYGCARYGSVAELLADPSIDAVHVLTNLETHHELTLQALAAGKHVLVEKPVGVTVAEIEEMAAAATAAGLVCMPGHNYVYEDGVQRAGELIKDGASIGRLVAVYVLYNIHHSEEIARLAPSAAWWRYTYSTTSTTRRRLRVCFRG